MLTTILMYGVRCVFIVFTCSLNNHCKKYYGIKIFVCRTEFTKL